MQLGKFYRRKGVSDIYRKDALLLTIELDEGCEVMENFQPPILYLEWLGVTGSGGSDHRKICTKPFASHEEADAFMEKIIKLCEEVKDAERPVEDGECLQEEG